MLLLVDKWSSYTVQFTDSRQLGVGYSLLNGWITSAELARSKGQGLAMALEEKARLAALEKEVALLREENEILKKAHPGKVWVN